MGGWSGISFVGDFHCHSTDSTHAYNTVFENIARAAELGLRFLAVTDHGLAGKGPPLDWFENLCALPRRHQGVLLLSGIETDVLDAAGRLCAPADTLGRLDIVIASMRRGAFADPGFDACAQAWLAVARNPAVDIIGHCGTPLFAFDHAKVVRAFAEAGKVVELNTHSFICRKDSYRNCLDILALCKKLDVRIAVDSDAHVVTEMGRFAEARAMLDALAFPPELVVNASVRNADRFFDEKGFGFRLGG